MPGPFTEQVTKIRPTTRANPALGLALALSSSLLFGLNATTSKILVTSGISPELMVIFRSAATAGLAGAWLLLSNRSAFKVRKTEWPQLIGFGIVGVGLMQWAYTQGVSRIPIGISLLIEYTAIVMVPLAAWVLFRTKVGKSLWIGIPLVLIGLAIVGRLGQGSLDPIGAGFAFLAAVFLTVYFIMGERIQRNRDAFSALFYSMAIATVFWVIVNHPPMNSLPNLSDTIALPILAPDQSVPLWTVVLWLGVGGSFAPMLLSYLALRHLSASGVGIASTSETIFAFLFAYLLLGEKIDGLQAIGGLLVISGIVIAQLSKSPKQE
jgi:drug/metabolite transporter (DMT)-like permease